MSITSDIRAKADDALEQGKQVLDKAQAQFNDATGQANDFVAKLSDSAKDNVSELKDKAADAVSDLRTQAEKAVNLDAIKAAVEPYVARAKGYTRTVSDRAEELLDSVKNDKRVAKLVDTTESFTGTVVETVQDRVVKPVQKLVGREGKPAVKPVVKAAAKPAAPATKPVAKPAARASVRKAPAKRSATKA